MEIKKEITKRFGHLPTTAAGLVIITAAVLHFTGMVKITEMKEFAHELESLLLVLGLGGIISKGWGKL